MKSVAIKNATAGSNAGRGFRYQDMFGALSCARMVTVNTELEALVPEGSDDYELRYSDGSVVLVDTKATRPEARLRTQSEDSKSLETLWGRQLRKGVVVKEYWIVGERTRADGNETRTSAESLFTKKPAPKSQQSFLVHEPEPLRVAVELFTEHRGLTPIAAELVVIALYREVGELASSNGALQLDSRKALTVTEIEQMISRVLVAVDAGRLDGLVRSGFLEPVNFTTPIADAGFYLGVDVQPGHFASGLAVDRPEAAARILEAAQNAQTAIVVGPSGAGKSGLMWNAVITGRHGRLWFRIKSAGAPDSEALTAFFEAYAGAPIGIVLDDIGRGRLDVWNSIRAQIAGYPDAILLGSIRSEDVALLSERHSIIEISAVADSDLARTLWERLRENEQTKWEGWNEPWKQSNGLLLEYGHILSQGERLGAIILDQVRNRLNEQRDAELAILAATAAVAEFGGVIFVETLRSHLGLSAGNMARALERLIEEHLVRIDASGARLTGLHALRASAICSALIEIGYSTRLEQATGAICVVAPETIEACVGGLVACGAIDQTDAGKIIAARFATGPVLSELAGALRGLRSGNLTLITQSWVDDLQAHDIPPKLATMAAILGVSQSDDLPQIANLRTLSERGRVLFANATAFQPESALVEALITTLASSHETNPADVTDALGALALATLSDTQLSALTSIRLPFEEYSISTATGILDAAEAINPSLSAVWADPRNTNQHDLLTKLVAETPFALPLVREQTDNGVIVHADIYEATLEPGENPNDRLFAYAKTILRVDQTAQVAHVRLVDASSEKSLHLDAEKRIPRENAPPDALASSNRLVVDFVARAVGGDSWSAYLSRGEELLTQGNTAFQRVLDSAMVGRVNEEALEAVNAVVGACDNLIAPADSADESSKVNGRHLTPLQDLIFNLNGQLVVAVSGLPKDGARTAARARDLIIHADEVKDEPWSLIRDEAPPILKSVRSTLNDIEIVALESAASGKNPTQRWPKKNRKPKDAFSFVSQGSRGAFARRIEARRKILEATLERELPNAKVRAPSLTDGILWQSKYIAFFPISKVKDLKSWMTLARVIGARISSEIHEEEDIAIVPLINDLAAIDYCFQLSIGKPNSMVAEVLNAAGQVNMLAPLDPKLVHRLGREIISHPPELEKVFLALRDISGMIQLGLGEPKRPLAERKRLEDAFAEIQANGPTLLDLFVDIDYPAVSYLRALLEFSLDDSKDISDVSDGVSMDGFQTALAELTWKRAYEVGNT